MGSLLLCSGSWWAQDFLVTSKNKVCFSQSCGSPVSKPCWPSKSDSLGMLSPFTRSPGWKAWQGPRTCVMVGELLWYYCSPVCGSPTCWEWDLILSLIFAPFLLSSYSFAFVLGHGISFFAGFQCPPVNGYSAASCDFGVLTEKDECTSFYSAILTLPPWLL